jgi:enoyl-CoA hydratase
MVRNGPVATIILNRPAVRNAIDRETADKLASLVKEFDGDSSLKVGVLWGVGNFCAGADLKAIREGSGCRLTTDGNGPLGPTRMQLSKPMIAAVSGAAVAGGLELALWCDMRIVEEDAYFGVFCRNWGVPLIDGGTGSSDPPMR